MSRRNLIQTLWAEHRFALQAFFRRRIRSHRDAADLTQEVYFRLLRSHGERSIENPEAYLFTVARNILTEHVVIAQRQSKKVPLTDPIVDAELIIEPVAESEVEHAQQVKAVQAAIQEMDDPHKAVLRMIYEEGLSYSQIARRLDVNKSMVGKYFEQAINQCRERLGRRRAL